MIYGPSPRDVQESRTRIHRTAAVFSSDVQKHYSYQTITSTLDYRPSVFVDISEQLDEKLELIAEYRSEPSFRPHLRDEVALASARYWGRFLGYTFAEPLEVLGVRGGASSPRRDPLDRRSSLAW